MRAVLPSGDGVSIARLVGEFVDLLLRHQRLDRHFWHALRRCRPHVNVEIRALELAFTVPSAP